MSKSYRSSQLQNESVKNDSRIQSAISFKRVKNNDSIHARTNYQSIADKNRSKLND